MHTTEINTTTFIHDGDYFGEIVIKDSKERSVTVPFDDLKEFIAEYVRAERTRKLEDASADDLLGL